MTLLNWKGTQASSKTSVWGNTLPFAPRFITEFTLRNNLHQRSKPCQTYREVQNMLQCVPAYLSHTTTGVWHLLRLANCSPSCGFHVLMDSVLRISQDQVHIFTTRFSRLELCSFPNPWKSMFCMKHTSGLHPSNLEHESRLFWWFQKT